ncbi:DUF2332 domain-containing protein [uncultured Pseudokineococcus sp.]|uniref:DUF2332 domain-containing protein n=1 Tax=uncultured Pseudokineococcus sp. TaxID=1642928 RepID=UPI00261A9461|nr:DUF2332 domain-containing protein [uncultured Pseudokineococcus sp.]
MGGGSGSGGGGRAGGARRGSARGPGVVVEHLRRQGAMCRELGAPFTAALCEAAADDAARGGPVAEVLRGRDAEPGPSALALRLVGALGRLVSSGAAPELARAYPGDARPDGAPGPWPGDPARAAALLPGVVRASADVLRADLGTAPQTNEVGRAAALWGGLLRLLAEGAGDGVRAADGAVPVHLHDVGASAGLLLQADRMRMTAQDGGAWGPPSSPVVLEGAWDVSPWLLEDAPGGAEGGRNAGQGPPAVRVVGREGVDVAPLDPLDPADARRLLSFVWPEQRRRVHRLQGALALARAHPVAVRRAGAAELARGLELREGVVTVVWQSVVRQYVPEAERSEAEAALDALGRRASPERPLVRLALEPRRLPGEDRHRFVVEARVHGGPAGARAGAPGRGGLRLIGEAEPHGVPVTWGTPPPASGRGA